MKNMKRSIRRRNHLAFAAVLAGVLLFGTALTVFASEAASTPNLDFNEEGSITVTLYSEEANATVKDGALTLYHVADLYLDDGNMAYSYTEDWDGCTASLEDPTHATLDSDLAAYAEDNEIAGTETLEINSDGSVTFSGLKLGLYLITQTTQSEGYYVVDPFVVTVPVAGESGWVYNVDASPKVEVYPTPEIPEESTSEEPTPEGTVEETPVPTGETLPQTGQLVWPIPILAAAGLVCCLIGWKMKKTDRRNRMHAA